MNYLYDLNKGFGDYKGLITGIKLKFNEYMVILIFIYTFLLRICQNYRTLNNFGYFKGFLGLIIENII